MKKAGTLFLACMLVAGLCAGCATGTAANTNEEESQGESLSIVEGHLGEEGPGGTPGEPPQEMPDQMGDDSPMGQIVSVTDTEITLLLAQIPQGRGGGGMPGGNREGPGQGGQPPGGDAPEGLGDGEPPALPEGEGPGNNGQPGERGGGRRGGSTERSMEITYSDEETTYTLSSDVIVTKGMGENTDTLTLEDLAPGDTVRILLDREGLVTEISVMDMEPGESSEESPTE